MILVIIRLIPLLYFYGKANLSSTYVKKKSESEIEREGGREGRRNKKKKEGRKADRGI